MANDLAAARIILADDHPLMREALRTVLTNEGYSVVAEAWDGDQTLDLVILHKPDLLILDLDMPGISGVALVQAVSQHQPSIKLLMVTAYSDEIYYKTMLDCGVHGFLVKSTPSQKIVAAVTKILDGYKVFPDQIKVDEDFNVVAVDRSLQKLTSREREVLWLLAKGIERDKILELLKIRNETLNNYVSNLYAKLGVKQDYIQLQAKKWIFSLTKYAVPIRTKLSAETKKSQKSG